MHQQDSNLEYYLNNQCLQIFSLIRIRRLRLLDSSAPLPCYAVVVSHRTRHLRAPCELGRSDKIPSYNGLKRIKRPTEYSEKECVTPVLLDARER